jgi:hypothetical protein
LSDGGFVSQDSALSFLSNLALNFLARLDGGSLAALLLAKELLSELELSDAPALAVAAKLRASARCNIIDSSSSPLLTASTSS